MTLECARVGGINLAQDVCDTELPEKFIEEAPSFCAIMAEVTPC